MTRLVLNSPALKSYLKEQQWTLVDLSERMRFSYDMIQKVIHGSRNPGGRFVAGLLCACEGGTFDQFFTIIEDKKQLERG
ncbi:helix-turn-helix domain-containing protein [Mesobacillus zeae]|uniref:helix-turn-helix domain-containing protein n=1 Tax=Mesobacillus zeae TaxID=1917180 RepID=UPI00300AC93D